MYIKMSKDKVAILAKDMILMRDEIAAREINSILDREMQKKNYFTGKACYESYSQCFEECSELSFSNKYDAFAKSSQREKCAILLIAARNSTEAYVYLDQSDISALGLVVCTEMLVRFWD